MSTLTNTYPHLPKAGEFQWPEAGHTAFEPKTSDADAFTVRSTRIEFPNAVTLLRVNEILVVAEPQIFSDDVLRARHAQSVAAAGGRLAELGVYVVQGTQTLAPRQSRPNAFADDGEFAIVLLREFVTEAIQRAEPDGMVALNLFTVSTPIEDAQAVLEAVSPALRVLATAPVPRNGASRRFFRELGMFLEHENGNFLRIPVPAAIDALAKGAVKPARLRRKSKEKR